MSKDRFFIGKILYGEWLIPIVQYYSTVKRNELVFEFINPIIISIITTIIYGRVKSIELVLDKMEEMLPNVLAILIGFTLSCIAMLISADIEKMKILSKKLSEREIGNNTITFHRLLLVTLSYILIIQVFGLIGIFFAAFLTGLITSTYLIYGIVIFEVFMLLHILFILIRIITNLYCIYSNQVK